MSALERLRARLGQATPATPTDFNFSHDLDSYLRALFILYYKGERKSLWFYGGNKRFDALVNWFGPFPSENPLARKSIPHILNSFNLTQIKAALPTISPGIWWPYLVEAIVEAEKISIDEKSRNS